MADDDDPDTLRKATAAVGLARTLLLPDDKTVEDLAFAFLRTSEDPRYALLDDDERALILRTLKAAHKAEPSPELEALVQKLDP